MTKGEILFLELLKAGLWNDAGYEFQTEKLDFQPSGDDGIWNEVYEHAKAQTVVGIVADGIQAAGSDKVQVPQNIKFQIIPFMVRVEKKNEKMNAFLPQLIRKLEKNGLHSWLLKGQGVAQCYPKPLHRHCGDIDLFFHRFEDYEAAVDLLLPYNPTARKKDELEINGITVELHHEIVARTNRRLQRNFPTWMQQTKDHEPEQPNELIKAVLPPVAFDSIYIFIHMMRHYFEGGIGLRQVSDWMRFLHVHRTQIDSEKLRADLKMLGVTKIWQVFGAMAVDFLGCPQDSMPLYSPKYSKDGAIILQYILRSGNFGYFDDRLQNRPENFYLGKLYSFWGQTRMILRNLRMFPEESLRAMPVLIKGGMGRVKDKK